MQSECSQGIEPSQEGKRSPAAMQVETCRVKNNSLEEEDKGTVFLAEGTACVKTQR